jgi:hypothetical protein
LSVIFGLT